MKLHNSGHTRARASNNIDYIEEQRGLIKGRIAQRQQLAVPVQPAANVNIWTPVTTMGFRFRLGPFTFGRSGTRLSVWLGGIGFSIPLTGRGRTFGKVAIGPFSWYGQSGKSRSSLPAEASSTVNPYAFTSEEVAAIEAFRADQRFLQKLQRNGMPWRGVQERLKKELPRHLAAVDRIAYCLVPKAMSAVFGEQGIAWSTVKRPSKGGTGLTTWIVVKSATEQQ